MSTSGGSGVRMYGDDGSVINAAYVRAITRDVLAASCLGAVTLVMDIPRSLYRTA